jgi:hypothetical protein
LPGRGVRGPMTVTRPNRFPAGATRDIPVAAMAKSPFAVVRAGQRVQRCPGPLLLQQFAFEGKHCLPGATACGKLARFIGWRLPHQLAIVQLATARFIIGV